MDEAHAGMKWFRSNVRLVSRFALFALAIQFLLSFGHFHGSNAQAATALVDANLRGLHHTVSCGATHLGALDGAWHANISGPVSLTSSFDHESDGQRTGDCAICATMALANALVVATPPCLLGPQTASFLLTPHAEFVPLNSACVGFQARAPPNS